MFNVLLDPLPEEWNGYRIDADFQIGIQISQCLMDKTLSDTEKFFVAVDLLFPGERPNNQEAAEAVIWFLNEYDHDNHPKRKKSEVIVMDFDIDQWRIYSAFLSQYHIDLNTVRMHWFTFMGLLSNLSECAFTHVMGVRQKKITAKMSAEERRAIKEEQKVFAIVPPREEHLSAKEQERVRDFMKYAKLGKREKENK